MVWAFCSSAMHTAHTAPFYTAALSPHIARFASVHCTGDFYYLPACCIRTRVVKEEKEHFRHAAPGTGFVCVSSWFWNCILCRFLGGDGHAAWMAV